MSNIIVVGFTTEGTTDTRFLEGVIRRTFEKIAFDCKGEIVVYDIRHIQTGKGDFPSRIEKAATEAARQGVMVLCVHTDADSADDADAFGFRIQPAFQRIKDTGNHACEILVAVVPVQMTEAWMLADGELLKNELMTAKTSAELGIDRKPEMFADPKATLKEAIRIAFEDMPKRRRRLDISELYLPLGQKIPLEKLSSLSSFQKFETAVRDAYKQLNYLST